MRGLRKETACENHGQEYKASQRLSFIFGWPLPLSIVGQCLAEAAERGLDIPVRIPAPRQEEIRNAPLV